MEWLVAEGKQSPVLFANVLLNSSMKISNALEKGFNEFYFRPGGDLLQLLGKKAPVDIGFS